MQTSFDFFTHTPAQIAFAYKDMQVGSHLLVCIYMFIQAYT